MSGKVIALKKTIKSAKTTKKITRAMELVAASKMKYFQNIAQTSSIYTARLKYLFSNNFFPDSTEKTFLSSSNENGKDLYVLYSSDKGLCGGMNTKLFKSLSKHAKNKDIHIITVGKKGFSFAKKSKYNISKSFTAIPEKSEYFEILKVVDSVLSTFKSQKIKDVYLVMPNYKSTLVFYPKVKKVLPLTAETVSDLVKDLNDDQLSRLPLNEPVIIEPDRDFVKEKLEEYILVSIFYSAFLELKAVEYSSRMVAMQSATKSADDLIEDLTLKYNSVRQAVITQQIIEVLGGS
jgi:F-type H+-transporting ATPase subunit gamma